MNQSKHARKRAIWVLALLSVVGCALLTHAAEQIVTLPDGRRAILYEDFTWQYYEHVQYDFDFSTLSSDTLPSFLRQGVPADVETQTTAVEMYLQGWRYTMPSPKSSQARWGNYDGRTTWYYGYWLNTSTDPAQASQSTPQKAQNGVYYGDDQDKRRTYRSGGSPARPTLLEWLLSSYGGIEPR